MFLVVIAGVASFMTAFVPNVLRGELGTASLHFFPVLWLSVVCLIGLASAIHHRRYWLVALAPAAVLYVVLSYTIWLVHGFRGLLTGREPQRDKPTRYAHVVA